MVQPWLQQGQAQDGWHRCLHLRPPSGCGSVRLPPDLWLWWRFLRLWHHLWLRLRHDRLWLRLRDDRLCGLWHNLWLRWQHYLWRLWRLRRSPAAKPQDLLNSISVPSLRTRAEGVAAGSSDPDPCAPEPEGLGRCGGHCLELRALRPRASWRGYDLGD